MPPDGDNKGTSWVQGSQPFAQAATLILGPNGQPVAVAGWGNAPITPPTADGPAWAHPVIHRGKLYLRHNDLLACYDLRK